jgi:hypothetical protein
MTLTSSATDGANVSAWLGLWRSPLSSSSKFQRPRRSVRLPIPHAVSHRYGLLYQSRAPHRVAFTTL